MKSIQFIDNINNYILKAYENDFHMTDNQGWNITYSHIQKYLNDHKEHVLYLYEQILSITNTGNLSEIGVGYGALMCAIHNSSKFNLHAYELDSNIDIYCRGLSSLGIPVLPLNLYDKTYPILQCSQDIIILSEVIEHLYCNPSYVISKLHNGLKKGGYLILSTPNIYRLGNLIRIFRNDTIIENHPSIPLRIHSHVVDSRGHPKEYTVNEIHGLFHSADWSSYNLFTKSYRTGIKHVDIPYRAMSFLSKLYGTTIYCIAQKK